MPFFKKKKKPGEHGGSERIAIYDSLLGKFSQCRYTSVGKNRTENVCTYL